MTPTNPQTDHHIDVISKERAVAFLEWANNDGWRPHDNGKISDYWMNPLLPNTILSTPDLYDYFFKETQQ